MYSSGVYVHQYMHLATVVYMYNLYIVLYRTMPLMKIPPANITTSLERNTLKHKINKIKIFIIIQPRSHAQTVYGRVTRRGLDYKFLQWMLNVIVCAVSWCASLSCQEKLAPASWPRPWERCCRGICGKTRSDPWTYCWTTYLSRPRRFQR